MAHFLAITALRSELSDVKEQIVRYAENYGVACAWIDIPRGEKPIDSTDALGFSAVDGWSIILWPEYFNIHDFPVAKWLSGSLGTVVSTINVYDDRCWSHGLFVSGKEIDRFCSDPEAIDAAAAEWLGAPDRVAQVFDRSAAVVSKYYVRVLPEMQEFKVLPDDEFPLVDFWVFTDFWRRMGINYPDPARFDACLRFDGDFSVRLPTIDDA